MNLRTMKKLEKLGYDKDWLLVLKNEWKPKKTGQYEMLITDIEDLGDDPRDGVFIERTRFNDDYDLSIIHYFFEGNTYVITDTATGAEIDSGYLNWSVFDFMEDYTGEKWDMASREMLDVEKKLSKERCDSMIESLTKRVNELELENAKLRLQLKEK